MIQISSGLWEKGTRPIYCVKAQNLIVW